ncbi:MAG: hypothetical protein ACFBQW_04290, partial [Sphingomonadaceae bacterium]
GRARLARGEAPPLARDEIVRRSRHGRHCVMRVGPGRWSAEKEEAFLAALTETANVAASARAVKTSTTALYRRRARDARFAARWRAALGAGYEDIELLLIREAKEALGGAPGARRRGGRRLKEPMTAAEAINLLKLHRASVKGGRPQLYGWRAAESDIEEVRAEMLRKVEALIRAGVVRGDHS